MHRLGSNTNAPLELLRRDCILCVGEDRQELAASWAQVRPVPLPDSFRYRCYEFWARGPLTVILAPMGTGALEPLLWEILQPAVVRRLLLVGTAGLMEQADLPVGRPYAIHQAYLAGTALDGENVPQPLRPRWPLHPRTPTAASASTEFFYGFSPRLPQGDYPFAQGHLRKRYEELRGQVQLVEMEVASFYCLCQRFTPQQDLAYLAIKSPTNTIGDWADQLKYSPRALAACLRMAFELLDASELKKDEHRTLTIER